MHRCPGAHVVVPHTHRPPALQVPVLPALHEAPPLQVHPPAVQRNPGVHACPHAPQLATSIWMFLHPPGESQHVCPAAQPAPPLHLQRFAQSTISQSSPRLHVEPPQVQIPVFTLHCPGKQSPSELHPHRFAGRLPPPQLKTLLPYPVCWQLFPQLPQFSQS